MARPKLTTLAQVSYFGSRKVRDYVGAGAQQGQQAVDVAAAQGALRWSREDVLPLGLFKRSEVPGVIFAGSSFEARFQRRDVDDFISERSFIAESSVKGELAFIAPAGAAAPTSAVADIAAGLAPVTILVIKVEDKVAHVVAAVEPEEWERFVHDWGSGPPQ